MLLEQHGSTFTAAYAYGNALIRKDGEYPLFDGLGSERTVTNSSQTVTGKITFEGFGQTVATSGSSTNPYMFGVTRCRRLGSDCTSGPEGIIGRRRRPTILPSVQKEPDKPLTPTLSPS